MNNLLVITTLYPNAVQSRHGVFVETRLRHLLASGEVQATVIAPVPWFPFKLKYFPEYSQYTDIPSREFRNGIEVIHPRYLIVPRIGMLLTPLTLALSLSFTVWKLRRKGLSYDVVDAHYYYPDGVSVALIAQYLAKPFLVTARGTDINLIPRYSLPRRMILWAARRAAASITVCQALKREMVELGAEAEKIHVMRNGVDLQLFRLLNQEACKLKYGVCRPTMVSVGHLIERKGHHHVIEALQFLPGVDLLIAGDGEEEENLRGLVAALALEDRVKFLGALTQQELAEVYNAVDVLVLASSREGWANVLLESMACGTPVVATNIWGTPEVVKAPEAGVLVSDRTGRALADGVDQLLRSYPSRDDTRSYAECFSWDDTVAGLIHIFSSVRDGDGLTTEYQDDHG